MIAGKVRVTSHANCGGSARAVPRPAWRQLPGGMFPDPERSLAWVDRAGQEQPLALPARAYLSPRISPDGQRVVLWTQGDRNVWVHDLARGTLSRLTSEARNARAIWTPDGTRVTYGSATGGNENIFWKPADGSGPAERLTTSDYMHFSADWSPDRQTLAFIEGRPETGHAMDASFSIRRHERLAGRPPSPK